MSVSVRGTGKGMGGVCGWAFGVAGLLALWPAWLFAALADADFRRVIANDIRDDFNRAKKWLGA